MSMERCNELMAVAPVGTTLFGMALGIGDGDTDPFPAFYVKVGRGEARSRAIGDRPRVDSQASVMRSADGKIALIPFAFRLGNYPKVFLTWLDHYDQPSPLEIMRQVDRYTIFVFENKPQPKKQIRTGNNPKFWETLLQYVRPFAPWTPAEFQAASEAEMKRTTPTDLYRIMKGRNQKSY